MANNYFYYQETSRYKHDNCVFISHQKRDAKECRKIADYLRSKGIDVYFDEYDTSIDRSNPDSVVSAIKRGIDFSKYMLCVVSSNTLASSWVPWEVGYGYDKTELAILTLKGIDDNSLPEYLRASYVKRNFFGLSQFINRIRPSVITEGEIRYFSASNPLYDILD